MTNEILVEFVQLNAPTKEHSQLDGWDNDTNDSVHVGR
jgi:hypothetical protein